MFKSKIIVMAALIACANSRHLFEEQSRPYLIIEDSDNGAMYVLEDPMSVEPLMVGRDSVSRARRQAHGNINTNPDGTSNVGIKLPLAGDDKNKLSAIGSIGGASNGGFKAAGGGVAWDNVNGHGATLTGNRIPDFGNQLTAAAKANLFHNDKHDVSAQAFATRTFPNNPNIPNFDTYGGKVGYTYDNKVGAALGMAHTDLFKKTDYSAMGNLNLFRDRSSSLDLNAGFSKSISPYMPSSRWEPSGGLSFTRFF